MRISTTLYLKRGTINIKKSIYFKLNKDTECKEERFRIKNNRELRLKVKYKDKQIKGNERVSLIVVAPDDRIIEAKGILKDESIFYSIVNGFYSTGAYKGYLKFKNEECCWRSKCFYFKVTN